MQPDRITMQGFRARARPILDEVLGFRPVFIEHQPGRGPSRDGFEGRGLDRCDQLIRIRGSGTELAVEGLSDRARSQEPNLRCRWVRRSWSR